MKIIGHRGAGGIEPENTLLSIKKALDFEVDGVEFDVYQLKTGEVVLMHDDRVNRTTDGHGEIKDYSFADLRKLDAGKGQKVPTLQEALDLIDRKTKVYIELKGPHTAEPVSLIIKQYVNKHGWKEDDFAVLSFDHVQLGKFKEFWPKIEIMTLINLWQWVKLLKSPQKSVELAKSMGASAVNPDYRFANKALVRKAHDAGLTVNVYSPNEEKDIRRMYKIGVDAIFGDFPDKAIEVLRGEL